MKFSLGLVFLMSIFMLGCGSTSSQETKNSAASSKFLTIQKGPSRGDPIAINQKFSIIFSSDIDPKSVSSASIYIEELEPNIESTASYGYPKGASLDVASKKITLTPYTYFNQNNNYRIVVTTGVKDINGRSLAKDYVYEFLTQAYSDDNGSFILESKKPLPDSTTLVDTDIVLDFSKNISSEAEYSSSPYFSVDANGTAIVGKTEVFNRLLRFIPHEPLPHNAQINVTLNQDIFDIYDSESVSLASWKFQTRDANSSPKSSLGFKSLYNFSLGKTAYLVRTIKNTSTESIIAVARDGGIDIYKATYLFSESKPTFEYVSSYDLCCQVNAMVGFLDKYLLVGTISQGVKVLDITTSPIIEVGDYNTTASIYGVKVGINADGFADKAYAVGPTFGLQVYDINSSSGVLTPTVSQSPSVLGEALDVATASVDDGSGTGTNVQKIYVADYKGRLVILDENATFFSSVDMNSSTKKIIVQKDYNGGNSYLSLLSASGIHNQMDFNGTSRGGSIDLTKSANDMLGYSNDETSSTYYAVGSDGITISDADYIQELISTSGNAVSLDFVKSNDYTSFLVTLNSDGLLQVFNAHYDDIGPSLSSHSPQEDETAVELNATVDLYFYDDYLDVATINENSFSIKNNDTGDNVPFDVSINIEGGFVLTPTNNLAADHNYSVKISPTISDMIGNKFNDGNETIINFKTEAPQ